jgi:uncharacterized membrane protein YsdA (DUF1294 family)
MELCAIVPQDAAMPSWFWWGLLAINVATFVVFGIDKLCARFARQRIRESTLLWWTLLGGFVGAFCAIGLFRHKSSKQRFLWRAMLCTLLSPLWLLLWFVHP